MVKSPKIDTSSPEAIIKLAKRHLKEDDFWGIQMVHDTQDEQVAAFREELEKKGILKPKEDKMHDTSEVPAPQQQRVEQEAQRVEAPRKRQKADEDKTIAERVTQEKPAKKTVSISDILKTDGKKSTISRVGVSRKTAIS